MKKKCESFLVKNWLYERSIIVNFSIVMGYGLWTMENHVHRIDYPLRWAAHTLKNKKLIRKQKRIDDDSLMGTKTVRKTPIVSMNSFRDSNLNFFCFFPLSPRGILLCWSQLGRSRGLLKFVMLRTKRILFKQFGLRYALYDLMIQWKNKKIKWQRLKTQLVSNWLNFWLTRNVKCSPYAQHSKPVLMLRIFSVVLTFRMH